MPKIFTIWSVDGGVGKTTLSVNMAFKTAMMFPDKKVALLDFNLFNPDIDLHLGINNKDLNNNMLDYFVRNDVNFESIERYMIRHEDQKNLYIMPGLYDINFFDKINLEHFISLFEYLNRMEYDYIYVDINSALNIDATFISLCRCDKLIVVGEPSYPCLRNINRYIDGALKKLFISEDKIEIIINKFDNSLVSKDEITHIFGRDDITLINASKAVMASINKSEPFVLSNSKELKKSIMNLEELIKKITQ